MNPEILIANFETDLGKNVKHFIVLVDYDPNMIVESRWEINLEFRF